MPAVDVAPSTPAMSAKDASKSIAVLEELLKSLSLTKTPDEAKAAATNIATLLNGPVEEQVLPAKYAHTFVSALGSENTKQKTQLTCIFQGCRTIEEATRKQKRCRCP